MKNSGYTLVEIMIVVAIAAILVALALPNYNESVRKSRRSDAQQDLLEIAGIAERLFSQTNSYLALDADADDKPDGYVSAYYDYSFTELTASTYIVQVAPKEGTSQDDDKCGTMTLSNTGEKTTPDEDSLAGCW